MWGRPAHVLPAGESWLVLVEVTEVEFGPSSGPLVYWNRAYHQLPPPLDLTSS
jgi:flavin reductase (DIM6/NTAB) family NADH-FMN oxidoreductase RutF